MTVNCRRSFYVEKFIFLSPFKSSNRLYIEKAKGGAVLVFSSLRFIFIFIPIFFILYYTAPYRLKNLILLIGSLCFYFIGALENPSHFAIFIISIIADWFAALLIEKYPLRKKVFLTASIAFHLISLCVFKYLGFFLQELNRSFPSLGITADIVLPIGISFYTFQGISYVADVYKGKVKAEKSLLNFAVYISMFEQLIAGPIVTYDKVRTELRRRKISFNAVLSGIGTFVFGLGLKVLLANPLGKLWSQVLAIGFESISAPLAWIAITAFSFQIYFDFFGYSLMALGLGKMLGFKLPKNFNHPYLSLTMTEFWRRWHITLGTWFREYVYIPLGGNKKGKISELRNLLAVWLLTGIWHGAGYNYLLWGASLFAVIAIEKFLIGKYLNRHPLLGHIYMLFLIPVTWAIFAIEDINSLGIFFSRLFPFFGQGVWSVFRYDYLKYLKLYFPFFIAGILFSTKLPYNIFKHINNRAVISLLLSAVFAVSVYCMYRGLDDPFLYFRF